MLNVNGEPIGFFNGIDDIRTLKFLARYIMGKGNHLQLTGNSSEAKTMLKDEMELAIKTREKITQQQLYIRERALYAATINLMDHDEFSWIEVNKRDCAIVYYRLTTTINSQLFPSGIDFLANGRAATQILFDNLNLKVPAGQKSHSIRLRLIKDYFEEWIVEGNRDEKRPLMRSLSDYSDKSLSTLKKLSWLDETDVESCDWAWNYLKDYHSEEIQSGQRGIEILDRFSTQSAEEKYLAICTALRVWEPHVAEKTLLLQNIKKAWTERQRRRNQVGNKAINVFVSDEVKEKLDRLASLNKTHQKVVITNLINQEYDLRREEIQAHLSL